jgi:hypothetical protein
MITQSRELDESRYMGILDTSSAHAGILRGDPMNVVSFPPAQLSPSRRGRPSWLLAGLGRRAGLTARIVIVLAVGLAPLGLLGCGGGDPGSTTRGCRDLAASQGSPGDIWGQVAADAHGTPLGREASDLEKLTVVRSSSPAYQTDLHQVISLCGRAGITV